MREANPTHRRICGRKTRDGDPCKMAPMRGQTVCRMHGGSSPQARATAKERMEALVHPALDALERLINNNDFNASRYVMDFAGFKAVEKVTTDGRQVIEVEYVGRAPITVESPHTNGHVLEDRSS